MIDYSADLYDPVYAEIGVPATLTAAGTAGEVALTVIDDTRPKRQANGSGVEVSSVAPGAFARMPELIANGVAPDDYMDAVLSFNGRSWVVRSYELRGSPNGEDLGEVRFLLKAIAKVTTPDDWVPADAKIHIDLLGGVPQGRAWVDGVGEVAVDTLLGSDPNTDAGWGASEYGQTNLTADGYVYPDMAAGHAVGFIGQARSQLFAGATLRFVVKQVDELQANVVYLVLVSADGTQALELDAHLEELNRDIRAFSWGGTLDETIGSLTSHGTGAINVVAATLTPLRCEFACNGSSPFAAVINDSDYPISGGSALVAALLDLTTTTYALQSITLYEPLPDTSGLSELSNG
jgi:hypothetical protein